MFNFLKKKPMLSSPRELSIPSADSSMEGKISFESSLPAPGGFDEEIPPPRKIDDIAIPKMNKRQDLPQLEFPEVPPEHEEDESPFMEEPEDWPELSEEEPLKVPMPKTGVVQEEPEEFEIPPLEDMEEEPMPVSVIKETHDIEEPRVIKEQDGPLFVDLNKYGRMMDNISDVRTTLKGCYGSLSNANTAKNLEDAKLAKWHDVIENMQRKLLYVDKTLFEK